MGSNRDPEDSCKDEVGGKVDASASLSLSNGWDIMSSSSSSSVKMEAVKRMDNPRLIRELRIESLLLKKEERSKLSAILLVLFEKCMLQ